jgi:DNA-binding MarR family transcriptional regulator
MAARKTIKTTPDSGMGVALSALVLTLANRLSSTGGTIYGQLGLSFLEARLLLLLRRSPGLIAARAVQIIRVDAGALSRSAQALESRGLIVRGPGGARAMSLTRAGQRLAAKAQRISLARDLALMSGFTDAETTVLADYFDRMSGNMRDVSDITDQPSGFVHADPGPAHKAVS